MTGVRHFDWIGFDADDTLWHNEPLFERAQDRFVELLSPYLEADWVRSRLYETETRNLAHFGYGIKAFALSMIESAAELTEGRITGREILELITLTKDMLASEVELLPGVEATLKALAQGRRLLVITKGDLLDQNSKMERSALSRYFETLEVVSDKTPETYRRILQDRGIRADRFLMVGNSIRSDVLPALEAGAWALHVPYETTWLHEAAEPPVGHERYLEASSITEIPGILARMESAGT